MASMVSETEIRRPFCGSSAQNATILSSIVASRRVLVEDVLLVAGSVGRGGAGRLLLLGPLQLPPILPHDEILYAWLRLLHTYLAYLLFATFLAHLGAALTHALIFRDGVFQSMTFRRR